MSKPPPPSPTPDGAAEAPPKSGKKKLILLVASVLLLLGAAAGLWFTGILPNLLGMKHGEQHHEEAAKPAAPVYVEMPDMVANLNGDPRRPSYLKLQSRLEVATTEDVEKVKQATLRANDDETSTPREFRP